MKTISRPDGWTSTRRAAALAALALAGLALCIAERAQAGPGGLSFRGCASARAEAAGCVKVPGEALRLPLGAAVSPDGRSLLITGHLGSLVELRLGPAGLAFVRCLSNGLSGCAPVAGTSLRGGVRVVVAANGASVYVAGYEQDAVSHFFRDPATGELAYDGCVSSDPAAGCTLVGNGVLDGSYGLAASPDGSVLFLSGINARALTAFKRAPQGQITFDGCVNFRLGVPGCTGAVDMPLVSPGDLAVSPASNSVYVAGSGSGVITHFRRAGGNGALFFSGCLGQGPAANGCGQVPGNSLDGLNTIGLSPDGESLYAAAPAAGALTWFRRDPEGALEYRGCFSGDPLSGCVQLPGVLEGATDVEVSAASDFIYVASPKAATLAVFERGVEGEPSYAGCFSVDPGNGCEQLPVETMRSPTAIAVDPASPRVYVASYLDDTVTAFGEAVPPSPRPPAPTPPTPTPPVAGTPPRCLGRSATIVGTAGRDVLRGTRGNDVIAALGGADVVDGRGGNDLICGGPGNDDLRGGPGADRIFGGAGRDRLLGGAGRDRCDGGRGRDRVACEREIRW